MYSLPLLPLTIFVTILAVVFLTLAPSILTIYLRWITRTGHSGLPVVRQSSSELVHFNLVSSPSSQRTQAVQKTKCAFFQIADYEQ